MVDREKVLTWLKICGEDSDCSGCCPYLTENNYANPMKYSNPLKCMEALMRDALELLKEQQPQWISVDDRLPDKQPDEYLVVNAHNVETAICLDNRWITPRRVTKITHWMPLPEPPEEASQE